MAFDDAGCKQYGTGFFYDILVDKGTIPVVLTNKHVLHGMSHAQINFSRADEKVILFMVSHINLSLA